MKRKFVLGFLFFISAFLAEGRLIRIGATLDASDASHAHELAEAGDTLWFGPGRHTVQDQLIYKNRLTITGDPEAILDGGGKSIFIIQGQHVHVHHLTLTNVATDYVNDQAAIRGHKANHILLEHLNIHDVFFGIMMERSNHGIVRHCNVLGREDREAYDEAALGNAVHMWRCDSMLIEHNTLTHCRDGVYLEFVEHSMVRKNVSEHHGRYGLHFMFSHYDAYVDNTFRMNIAGVAVMYSTEVRMENNHFKDQWGGASFGLLLKDITDSWIINNRLENNTMGIHCDNVSRVEFRGNLLHQNGSAMRIMGNCMDNTIHQNDFTMNSFDVVTEASRTYNTFSQNYWSQYSGFDFDHDGFGDVPYNPTSLYSYVISKSPLAIILVRSLFVNLLDLTEKISPNLTPSNLTDEQPSMHPNTHD